MSDKALAASTGTAITLGTERQIVVTQEQRAVIKSVIFPDATDPELDLYIYHCQRKGVHPMDKLIHPIKRAGKVSFQASIDYLRSESETAGDYRGMKQPVYEYDSSDRLESATITVIREINGVEIEFTATAYWNEFVPGAPNDFMWKKMPKHMLAKCAEALARRQAWPKKLADLYTPEEMAQADNPRTAVQNKSAARTETIKPAAAAARPAQQQSTTHRQDAQEAEIVDEVPLDEKIERALDYLTDGSTKQKGDLLILASRGGKTSGAFLAYPKLHLPETSVPWLTKTYEYLEPMVWDKTAAETE